MTGFTFIHAADIHLDSPLLGLERYEGAPVEYVRGATRRAFRNLVDLALEEEAKFLLIAGDLYDGDWRDSNTGLFFTSQAARLREAGIKLYLVRGNHDAASQITRQLRLPDNVCDLSTEHAETKILEELGVAVHGRGFPKPAVLDDLSRQYPEPLQGYFNIGLLHTCATGREGHDSYAPCDIGYLKNKGYSYWALGHVHKKEVISEEPWIVFPGNTQGRHIRESGAKGCLLVRVQEGQIGSIEQKMLDVLRWHLCQVDVGELFSYDEVLEAAQNSIDEALALSEGRLLALRLVFTGTGGIHHKLAGKRDRLYGDLRSLAAESGPDSAWVEKVQLKTAPGSAAKDIEPGSPLAALLQYAGEFSSDEKLLEELVSELRRDRNALPADIFVKGEMDPADPGYLQELLPEAEELILSRLLEKEPDSR
ncbi:MAG: DNA repair exonuclease [Firmicutes bacterium]|nr:DNA repair exonuclease [Bacillota bacterium]